MPEVKLDRTEAYQRATELQKAGYDAWTDDHSDGTSTLHYPAEVAVDEMPELPGAGVMDTSEVPDGAYLKKFVSCPNAGTMRHLLLYILDRRGCYEDSDTGITTLGFAEQPEWHAASFKPDSISDALNDLRAHGMVRSVPSYLIPGEIGGERIHELRPAGEKFLARNMGEHDFLMDPPSATPDDVTPDDWPENDMGGLL